MDVTATCIASISIQNDNDGTDTRSPDEPGTRNDETNFDDGQTLRCTGLFDRARALAQSYNFIRTSGGPRRVGSSIHTAGQIKYRRCTLDLPAAVCTRLAAMCMYMHARSLGLKRPLSPLYAPPMQIAHQAVAYSWADYCCTEGPLVMICTRARAIGCDRQFSVASLRGNRGG